MEPPNNSNPASHAPASGANPAGDKTAPSGHYDPKAGGGGFGAFQKWLGKAGYAQFQANLCQQISQQMAHQKEVEAKAAERLKKTEEGKDPDE